MESYKITCNFYEFSKYFDCERSVTKKQADAFIKAGYSANAILGVIAGVGVKTMSNYFNHAMNTPLDAAFAGRSWG